MNILTQYNDYGSNPQRKKVNGYGGVGYYRIIKPSALVSKEHTVKIIGKEITHFGNNLEEQWTNIFTQFDVFRTSYFENAEAAAAIFYMRDKLKKKVIIDVDDNYFDVLPSNPSYDKFKPGAKDRAFLSATLSFADAITVSTEPLRDKIKAHIKKVHGIDKPVYVIPNCNDVNDWNFKPVDLPKDRFTIGYSGSQSHKDDLLMVIPALKQVMEKYPFVWFELLGVMDVDELAKNLKGFSDDLLCRIAVVKATPTHKEYPEWMSQRPWHVGIAPLIDNAFNRSKSHIKWMEYSMYKTPVLASRTYPYFMELAGKEIIQDGETGRFVKDTEWAAAFEDMILNYDKRKVMGENAYEYIKNNWQYSQSSIGEVWATLLKNL